MNDDNTPPRGYGEGHRQRLATFTQTLWPRSTSISFSKLAFPQGAQHSPHLLICLWSLYHTPPSPVKAGFQQEHISDSWPGCSPADNYPLLSDLKTDLEGMLVRLLNQLKLMFRYTTRNSRDPTRQRPPALHVSCSPATLLFSGLCTTMSHL